MKDLLGRIVQPLGGYWNAFLVMVSLLVGTLVGVALFTFGYAGGANYFGSDPQTCNQCHAMNKQYNSWSKGSHKAVAGCNDCHAPHDDIIAKYWNKAENGFWHSLKFTTGDYPDNIKIRDHNREVTEQSCLHCHKEFVSEVSATRVHGNQISCLQCHAEVGHKR